MESPLLLIPLLLIGQYVLLVIWLRRRTRRARRVALVGLAVCVAAPVIQRLVVTDCERLRAVCRALVDATEEGDVEAIGRHVAKHFNVRGIDRDALLEGAGRVLSRCHVETASLTNVEIKITGHRATVRFAVLCTLITPDGLQTNVRSAWLATFERAGGRWLMIEVDPQPAPAFPFRRLEDLEGFTR